MNNEVVSPTTMHTSIHPPAVEKVAVVIVELWDHESLGGEARAWGGESKIFNIQ